jgi:hypothetical protein
LSNCPGQSIDILGDGDSGNIIDQNTENRKHNKEVQEGILPNRSLKSRPSLHISPTIGIIHTCIHAKGAWNGGKDGSHDEIERKSKHPLIPYNFQRFQMKSFE